MSEARVLPVWAEDLRRRYLRGEASMFVLHGNVYDVVIQQKLMLSLTENLTDLSPKLVSNPKVAVVEVPMPDRETRKSAALLADARLTERDAERYADITAGLKAIQISSILTPPPPAEEESAEREAFIVSLLGGGADAAQRAHKLAALTADMTRDEIKKLLAPSAAAPAQYEKIPSPAERARKETDRLI